MAQSQSATPQTAQSRILGGGDTVEFITGLTEAAVGPKSYCSASRLHPGARATPPIDSAMRRMFGLVARRPATARIAAHRAARRAEHLVERNAERSRLDVPHRDVNAGNCLHDDAAASAFISLGDATLERRSAARAVVHLFVDALGEQGILTDAFRRELVLDDGGDDWRRAESRADPGEAVVCFNADQRRITLDLGSKIGAVTLFLR